jgi:hypothetical protein
MPVILPPDKVPGMKALVTVGNWAVRTGPDAVAAATGIRLTTADRTTAPTIRPVKRNMANVLF